MAASNESAKVTNPKPLDCCSELRMIRHSVSSPYTSKTSLSSSCVIVNGKFFTKNRFLRVSPCTGVITLLFGVFCWFCFFLDLRFLSPFTRAKRTSIFWVPMKVWSNFLTASAADCGSLKPRNAKRRLVFPLKMIRQSVTRPSPEKWAFRADSVRCIGRFLTMIREFCFILFMSSVGCCFKWV